MSRVFVMGYELPTVSQKALEARSCRTWQFVESILEAGHEVCLIVSHTKDQSNVPQNISTSLKYTASIYRKEAGVAKYLIYAITTIPSQLWQSLLTTVYGSLG
jgi:hypothetical protein